MSLNHRPILLEPDFELLMIQFGMPNHLILFLWWTKYFVFHLWDVSFNAFKATKQIKKARRYAFFWKTLTFHKSLKIPPNKLSGWVNKANLNLKSILSSFSIISTWFNFPKVCLFLDAFFTYSLHLAFFSFLRLRCNFVLWQFSEKMRNEKERKTRPNTLPCWFANLIFQIFFSSFLWWVLPHVLAWRLDVALWGVLSQWKGLLLMDVIWVDIHQLYYHIFLSYHSFYRIIIFSKTLLSRAVVAERSRVLRNQ